MFDALSDRFDGIFTRLRSRGRLTEKDVDEVAREIRLALLEADVNVKVVKRLHRAGSRSGRTARRSPKSLSPAQQVIKIVHEELVDDARRRDRQARDELEAADVVMLAGLQGSGKTTAAGKLARHAEEPGPAACCSSPPTCSARPRSSSSACSGASSTCPCGLRPTTAEGPGRGRAHVARRSGAPRHEPGDRRHRRPAAGRHRADGRAARTSATRCNPTDTLLVVDAMTGQEAVNVATDVRRGGRPRRRDPHQDRRRRARWCRALGEGGRRQADPVRRDRREARGLRAVPPRPHGEPHPRHGRRAHADREGRGDLRRGARPRAPRRSCARASSRSRTSSTRCARCKKMGPISNLHEMMPGMPKELQEGRDRRGRARPGRGDHLLDDARPSAATRR